MNAKKITLFAFLKCFNKFQFNILTSVNLDESVEHTDSLNESMSHLTKMLQKARKELSKAHKLHKSGKLSTEELFDYEWHVSELEQQIRNIEDLNQE